MNERNCFCSENANFKCWICDLSTTDDEKLFDLVIEPDSTSMRCFRTVEMPNLIATNQLDSCDAEVEAIMSIEQETIQMLHLLKNTPNNKPRPFRLTSKLCTSLVVSKPQPIKPTKTTVYKYSEI